MSELTHPSTINRDYIRLLQVMRRFVKEEFAITIHMTQEDAVDQLLHYAALSRNHVLQEMAKELRSFVHIPEQEPQTENAGEHGTTVRYYRGAEIIEEHSSPDATPEQEQETAGKQKKRIYRGQVVD